MNDIIPLQKKDIDKMSELLARAFEKDDFVLYLLEGKENKFEKSCRIFKIALKFGLLYGKVYTTKGFEGVSIWFPPNKFKRPVWRWIRSGALGLIIKVGLNFLSRENPVTDLRDEIKYKHIKSPHWYLYAIAVDPVHQGKGYASVILKSMIKRIEQEELPIYLDTNTEENVPIYEYFGFKVLEKVVLPTPPRNDIFNWSMIKY